MNNILLGICYAFVLQICAYVLGISLLWSDVRRIAQHNSVAGCCAKMPQSSSNSTSTSTCTLCSSVRGQRERELLPAAAQRYHKTSNLCLPSVALFPGKGAGTTCGKRAARCSEDAACQTSTLQEKSCSGGVAKICFAKASTQTTLGAHAGIVEKAAPQQHASSESRCKFSSVN